MEKYRSIGHMTVSEDKHETDSLGVAIASYFDGRLDKPENDPIDEETGWSKWVMRRTDFVLDKIDAERDKLEAEIKQLREACECVVFDAENQDQGPVNDMFVIICDTTLKECKDALDNG